MSMTTEEKAAKFEKVQKSLWDMARDGNALQSTMAATLIRLFEIPGPNGEGPEEA